MTYTMIPFERVVFQSNLPPAETIEKLSHVFVPATLKGRWNAKIGKKIFIKCRNQNLCIFYHVPMRKDGFAPVFYGVVTASGYGSTISGVFRFKNESIIILLVLFVIALGAVARATASSGLDAISILIIAGLLSTGLLCLEAYRSKNDIVIISDAIRNALA